MSDIQSLLQKAKHSLQAITPETILECEILLAEVLQKNRSFLYAHPEWNLTDQQEQQFQTYIQQRAQGVPIAYITGKRDFWSLTLKVNQHTLIPRSETELLVEIALDLIPHKEQTQLLDLGTGSGAVALALAKERPHWQIHACDKSREALIVAQNNAAELNLSNITFFHSDWFSALPTTKYDAIVANPPYIAETDPHLQQGDLRFEPLSALASSQNGLADLQYIINHAKDFLLPKALLLLEHGFDQKNQLATILKDRGYSYLQCWKDIQGLDRISGGLYQVE